MALLNIKSFINCFFLPILKSWEDFQLLDNEPFDNSIIKGEYLKVHHQQGAKLNQSY